MLFYGLRGGLPRRVLVLFPRLSAGSGLREFTSGLAAGALAPVNNKKRRARLLSLTLVGLGLKSKV